jgi:beta-phosphoglucomutase
LERDVMHPHSGMPGVQPSLPTGWERLKFKVCFQGHSYQLDIRSRPESQPRQEELPRLPILGAILDLDGVITDTSELHYRAWKRLAEEEGIPFTRQDNEALRGVSRHESLLRLLKGSPRSEEEIQSLMEKKNQYYLELIRDLTADDLLPGVRPFIDEARKNDVRIAIGSASKNAKEVIDKLGIGDLIDHISDGYSVEVQKPAPDLFLDAAKHLGLPPGQCVVFEDAQAGIEAALAGGMWAIGIGPVARVGAADAILSALGESCWECVLEQLAECRIISVMQSFLSVGEHELRGEGDDSKDGKILSNAQKNRTKHIYGPGGDTDKTQVRS